MNSIGQVIKFERIKQNMSQNLYVMEYAQIRIYQN